MCPTNNAITMQWLPLSENFVHKANDGVIKWPIGSALNILYLCHLTSRADVSRGYVREGFPILSLSWWGWGSCYESVVLGAPFTPAGSTAEAERRVAHSISCDITL